MTNITKILCSQFNPDLRQANRTNSVVIVRPEAIPIPTTVNRRQMKRNMRSHATENRQLKTKNT